MKNCWKPKNAYETMHWIITIKGIKYAHAGIKKKTNKK